MEEILRSRPPAASLRMTLLIQFLRRTPPRFIATLGMTAFSIFNFSFSISAATPHPPFGVTNDRISFMHFAALLLAATALVPQRVVFEDGRRFQLRLPAEYELRVAAEGLRRVRFMAIAPDGRLFATDMYNRTDNTRGRVYVFSDFDEEKGRYRSRITYLEGLRNPNSIAFYKETSGQQWFYVALTDRLIRYRYVAGSQRPEGDPETIATFPAYGLDYKYGGWHLTRTIAFGPNDKLYVSVGSSCNACEEKEEVRATVLEMNPDGSNARRYVTGLRNAVGLRFSGNDLFATNMGADHLGDRDPVDTMVRLAAGSDHGWPYCYPTKTKAVADPHFATAKNRVSCEKIPPAWATFPAHASPLGLDVFPDGSFLVALHGSSKRTLGHGYRVVRVRDGEVSDFITGFLAGTKVIGRPADVLRVSGDSFLVSDDYAGVIYLVRKR